MNEPITLGMVLLYGAASLLFLMIGGFLLRVIIADVLAIDKIENPEEPEWTMLPTPPRKKD